MDALTMNCLAEVWKPRMSTTHMVQIKPTVPNTRMGGKAFTVSMPPRSRMLYATELESASVGM